MNIEALSLAAVEIFTPSNILIMTLASVLGMFVGAMPGMSSVMGLALLIPFTFKVKGYTGMLMRTLRCVYIVLDICKALLKVDWVISRSVVGCAAAWLLSLNNFLNAYTVNVGTICLDD